MASSIFPAAAAMHFNLFITIQTIIIKGFLFSRAAGTTEISISLSYGLILGSVGL